MSLHIPDEITPTEALGLIQSLKSKDWKLTHVPTLSTWSGEQVRTAVKAVKQAYVKEEKKV